MMTNHEHAMLQAINAARVERGIHALAADGQLTSDGQGADWMTTHNIVAELDAALWRRLTAAHGRPLRVEVRYEP